MLIINNLPSNARNFAQHCIENCNFSEVVEMVLLGRYEKYCARFDITEEQWQDAVYVVFKEMRRGDPPFHQCSRSDYA
ncbi:MAG: hypothetical protein R6V18_05780 [Desulfuromonadaceae bacterium]